MVTTTLVENQLDDGEILLDRLREEGIVVRAACWVKPQDDDRRLLYLVTPLRDEKGPLEAYRQVFQVLESSKEVGIDSANVKVIGAKHPIAQDVLGFSPRFLGITLTGSQVSGIGGIPVDEIYVYSLGKKEKVTIYGKVYRGEPGAALHLSLEPHNPNSSLTIENHGNRNTYPAETGIDCVVAAPAGSKLERDQGGQLVLTWNLHGNRRQSGANEVLSLADLGIHGFRILRKPD